MKSELPQNWFEDAILDGLSQLFSLGLQGTPAAELAPITAKTWAKVLWKQPIGWVEDADTWRIDSAFTMLMGRIDRFPAPRDLMFTMPERKKLTAIPAPKQSEEEMDANKKRLKEILKTVAG